MLYVNVINVCNHETYYETPRVYIYIYVYVYIYSVYKMNAVWQENKYPSARCISKINKPVVIKFLSRVLTFVGRVLTV
jgi:hypothetical protein